MPNQLRILIVLPDADVAGIRKHISEVAFIGAQAQVDIVGLRNKLPKSEWRQASEENTMSVAARLADANFQTVIVHGRIPLDVPELEKDYKVRVTKTHATLYKEISTALKDLGLDWLTHARKEWMKSSIPHSSPEGWVEQFARLGHAAIAKRLLKSLRVISDESLRNSFYTRKEEMLGLRVGHGFFSDEEKGSSSIAVQQVLEHMYPGKVHKLQIDNTASWASLDLDRLYIYEDGLWSGVELLRRLESIAESQEFKESNIHFYFKFSATSDVGLVAARLFTRKLKTSRFHFIPGEVGNHYEFFRRDADVTFSEPLSDAAALRELLDGLVEPYAFNRPDIWPDGRDKAISVCEKIGWQLVMPFLIRKKEEKNTASSKLSIVTDEDAKRWQLGAMNFASTVVFSSSIPKPVLPLMWLQGWVKINGLDVEWRPLFWDVRRTGTYDRGDLRAR